tara:strand:- start:166 stop:366 length:201 start_codon:yes stop_codon:yes gene_type:complete
MTAIKNNLEYQKISLLEDDLHKALETFDYLEYYGLKLGKKTVKKVSEKIDELHKLRYQYDKKRLKK